MPSGYHKKESAKIDPVQLDKLLREGKTGRQCAKTFGVTDAAVCNARKRLKTNIVRTVALEKASQVVEVHLDMMGQLRKVNLAINEELERAKNQIVQQADGREKLMLQEIIIKLSAEIRKQLDTQLRIAEIWYDQKVYKEFQEEVLAVLEELSPGARNEVIRKLKQRRTLRGLVSFN